MADSISNVKLAILDFITDNLKTSFPTYFTSDSQVYYEDTQPDLRSSFPYVCISVESDSNEGHGIFGGYEKVTEDGETTLYRVDKENSIISVTFSSYAMNSGSMTSLQAQNLAQQVIRFIRRILKSDESRKYFGYTNTYSVKIGANTHDITKIQYAPEYEDTNNKHRYYFSCEFNWQDSYTTEIDMAQAANIIRINDETVDIEIDLQN